MLTTWPPPTVNDENELNALEPLVVLVRTFVTLPLPDTDVSVRPSGRIEFPPAYADGPKGITALMARIAAMRRRPVPDLPRPLAISATAVQIINASFQTRRYRRFTDEWRSMAVLQQSGKAYRQAHKMRQKSHLSGGQNTFVCLLQQARHPPKE